MTVAEVLPLFAEHLQSVRENPNGSDHANVRALLECDQNALVSTVFQPNGSPFVDRQVITDMWEDRANVTPDSDGSAVLRLIDGLDCGGLRIASKVGNDWVTDQTLKQAVLLSFRLRDNEIIDGNGYETMLEQCFYDKVALKFAGWTAADFKKAGIRVVPGAVARRGSYIGKNLVLMANSFVNIGANIGDGTMIDTGARAGSCAQIGKNVHLGAGSGIGGVLEPLQANPTIVEDDVFIGAMCEVAEGVIIRQGSVLAMGCFITKSTPIVNRSTGEVTNGEIPPYSVVIPGSMPMDSKMPGLQKACVLIVKTVDAQTRSKTGVNDLLRD
jgi:2,3,4,5-tetrahydropyridine-2-carboxylate N-succinyltransferase